MTTPATSSEIAILDLSGQITLDAIIVGGERWANPLITYSFPDKNSIWSTDPFTGYGASVLGGEPWQSSFSPISTSDQTNFVAALQQWENVANIQFEHVVESATNVGDIRIAYTHSNDFSAQAWAYFESYQAAFNGDIWVESEGTSAIEEWDPGTFSFLTILHEIGHVLGLEHPFERTDFPVSEDTISATIMSYSAIAGNQDSIFTFNPTTAMPLDILAIQYLYGANKDFHNQNDVYRFDDTQTYHETIWDGGGENDEIIYTGQLNAHIDLREGKGSTIGNAVYASDATSNQQVSNIWIAFETVIENAQGGHGNDFLIGNEHNNVLSGGDGNDTLVNGAGNDNLYGGVGIDTAIFSGLRENYILSAVQAHYLITDQNGAAGQNTVADIERLTFDDTRIALDIDGHAGQIAKLLGSVFGAESVNNKAFVGIGLSLIDRGVSNEQLATVALEATGASSHDEVVSILWRNLFITEPTQEEKQPFVEMLNNGEISTASLTLLAAESTINADNINLVGLMQSGIEFIPTQS
ncbi:MAG: matrixin family metalloprotease [Betaproteobacteria bacterium]|nr:matrixin family metalloprotease [Betaproteobacteria bacterium]